MNDDHPGRARHELSANEWRAVEAIRAGLDPTVAASAETMEEVDFRRSLASAAEKLRVISLLPSVHNASTSKHLQIPQVSPCPYCENFAGRYSQRSGPPATVYEDDVVHAFLAPAPLGAMPGHTLVTTRRHAETIFDLSAAEAAALAVTVVQTARAIRAALDPPGLLVQQNNGLAAFQTVPHVHFHVIPKIVGPFPPAEVATITRHEERVAVANLIRAHWA
ncbi:MAG TPA: HIT domain-containing protein [Mycobacteriales bacterium]|nr:HIT domain-containing protein [Mycobacteriales bacterium]